MTKAPTKSSDMPAKQSSGITTRSRRRRKDARPNEIIEAALQVFGERGFGAARLEDVARVAGVSKGTLFVYYPNKQELFRAVAQSVLTTHLDSIRSAKADFVDSPLHEFVPTLLSQVAKIGGSGLPPIARLLVAESRAFPDLAQTWYDEVACKVLGVLTTAIERAQIRGEIRKGDPALYAFSIIGPMIAGTLFREVFVGNSAIPDLTKLAKQHADLVLQGLTNPEHR